MPVLLQTVRRLRRPPTRSLAVVLTLAISIGLITAVAAAVRASLLSALSYPPPTQLVKVNRQSLRGFNRNTLFRVLLREAAFILGLATILIASLVASHQLQTLSMQFVATPGGFFTLPPTAMLLIVAVLLSTPIPARRAAYIDPMQALQAE